MKEKIYIIGFGKHILLPHGIGRKILSDSFFEIFCFADIENLSSLVFEDIDSRRVWEILD